MAFSESSLSAFQREVLKAFFARERGFFLTGGAALVGFYLHHRSTDDLDLFTTEAPAFERGVHALADVAAELGAAMEARQAATGFHRYFLRRGEEAVIVDLVHDRVPQLSVHKIDRDGIVLDSLEEILVNKLNTIVSRCEIRDLVDVMTLEQSGLDLDRALHGALKKDGGCTPATLAWVLSEVVIPEQAQLPGGISGTALDAYRRELVHRLRRAALPESHR